MSTKKYRYIATDPRTGKKYGCDTKAEADRVRAGKVRNPAGKRYVVATYDWKHQLGGVYSTLKGAQEAARKHDRTRRVGEKPLFVYEYRGKYGKDIATRDIPRSQGGLGPEVDERPTEREHNPRQFPMKKEYQFVVAAPDGKVWAANEYRNDAQDALADLPEEIRREAKVLTKVGYKRMFGIEPEFHPPVGGYPVTQRAPWTIPGYRRPGRNPEAGWQNRYTIEVIDNEGRPGTVTIWASSPAHAAQIAARAVERGTYRRAEVQGEAAQARNPGGARQRARETRDWPTHAGGLRSDEELAKAARERRIAREVQGLYTPSMGWHEGYRTIGATEAHKHLGKARRARLHEERMGIGIKPLVQNPLQGPLPAPGEVFLVDGDLCRLISCRGDQCVVDCDGERRTVAIDQLQRPPRRNPFDWDQPGLGQAMRHTVAIYIPSAGPGGAPLPANLRQVWRDRVAHNLASWFGGCTALAGVGEWVNTSNELVKEPVEIIYSFCMDDQLDAYKDGLLNLAIDVQQGLKQAAVTVEVDGAAFLVHDADYLARTHPEEGTQWH